MNRSVLKTTLVAAALVVAFLFTVDTLSAQCGGASKKGDGCPATSCGDRDGKSVSCPATACSGEKKGACPVTSCNDGGSACASPKTSSVSCPFSQCVVTGRKIGFDAKPVVARYKGRAVYFADTAARDTFMARPDTYVARYDKALAGVQAFNYPLDRCLVTGKTFEEGKKPVDHLHDGRLVRLCCSSLIAEFNREPARYMAALDRAIIAGQGPTYPLDTCVVSQKQLGVDGRTPVDHIFGNQLVRLADTACVAEFEKDPRKHMMTVFTARASAVKKAGNASADASRSTCPVTGKKAAAATRTVAGKKDCCGSCQGGCTGTGTDA